MFLAPHEQEGYSAIPVLLIPTCAMFKAEHCHALRKPTAELCRNATFRGLHGFMCVTTQPGHTPENHKNVSNYF